MRHATAKFPDRPPRLAVRWVVRPAHIAGAKALRQRVVPRFEVDAVLRLSPASRRAVCPAIDARSHAAPQLTVWMHRFLSGPGPDLVRIWPDSDPTRRFPLAGHPVTSALPLSWVPNRIGAFPLLSIRQGSICGTGTLIMPESGAGNGELWRRMLDQQANRPTKPPDLVAVGTNTALIEGGQTLLRRRADNGPWALPGGRIGLRRKRRSLRSEGNAGRYRA